MADTPPFPGAVGLSHLRVYDTVAPDGLAGGTPHLHTLCTEMYAVIAGRGCVQTLTASGYSEVALEPGAVVWFTAGTIHRLVNHGDLEILVVMQNAGLPEAGDMVITFAPEVMADSDRYAAAAELPTHERTTAGSGAAAIRRRDDAVDAFVALRAEAASSPEALRRFHKAAVSIVQPRLEHFTQVWKDGPFRVAAETGDQLTGLAADRSEHLASASVHRLPPPPPERRMGCCGTLGTYIR